MIRLRLPWYRFDDDYGNEITALRKPWWRKRKPAKYVHITQGYEGEGILKRERVLDISDVVRELEPDTSQFTTMLMKLVARQEAYYYANDPDNWGFDWTPEVSEQAKQAHDHFLRQMDRNKPVYWIEDELFPRLSQS